MDNFFDWYLWYLPILGIFEFILISQKRKYSLEHPGLTYEDSYEYRTGLLFAILVFLPMFFISGFREFWYADTWAYVGLFESWPKTIGQIEIGGTSKYPGFIYFSVFIKQFISVDPRVWLVIIAGISVFCIANTFKRYTSEVVLCAFLFFCSTECQGWLMNGMRQFLAVSILFAFVPLVLSKRPSKITLFIGIGLLMYTFHISSLIALPVYFFALGKPFNKKTMIVLVLSFVAIIFLDSFLNIFSEVVSTTSYSSSVNDITSESNIGTNVFRVLVYSVPGILAIIFRKKIPDDSPDIIKFSVNMSLVTIAFYAISMFTSGIFFGRMPIYFSLFNYILLPWEINHFFPKDKRKIVYIIAIVLYILYYIIWN